MLIDKKTVYLNPADLKNAFPFGDFYFWLLVYKRLLAAIRKRSYVRGSLCSRNDGCFSEIEFYCTSALSERSHGSKNIQIDSFSNSNAYSLLTRNDIDNYALMGQITLHVTKAWNIGRSNDPLKESINRKVSKKRGESHINFCTQYAIMTLVGERRGEPITNDVLKIRKIIEFQSSCIVIYFSDIYLITDGKISFSN